MQTVNLYIDTDRKGPHRGRGAYLFLLELRTAAGPATLHKTDILQDATEHRLTLTALEAALKRIHKPCGIEIYMEDAYVAAAIRNGWPQEWNRRSWITKQGKPVRDAEIWRRILYLLNNHTFYVHEKECHAYHLWMERTLKGEEGSLRNGT